MFVCHFCGYVFGINTNGSLIHKHIKECNGRRFFCEGYGYMQNGFCLFQKDFLHLHKTVFAGQHELFICISCNLGFINEGEGIMHIVNAHGVKVYKRK
jgi:hypothetical protein